MPADALDALLRQRHSCRAFLDTQVDRQTIERLLTLAQRTPSWCNTQPWQVIVTSGDATRRVAAGLSEQAATGVAEQPDIAFPPAYRGVYLERRRVCGFQLYGMVDCGGYVSVFLLAAQSLGLATIPQAAIASYSPWLREHFALPPDRLVLCAISFGYADKAHDANSFRTERADLTQTVQWRE